MSDFVDCELRPSGKVVVVDGLLSGTWDWAKTSGVSEWNVGVMGGQCMLGVVGLVCGETSGP